jgi:hypothetical protein
MRPRGEGRDDDSYSHANAIDDDDVHLLEQINHPMVLRMSLEKRSEVAV